MEIRPVEYYGCVRCQDYHYSDTEPELFKEHGWWQSKHGCQTITETIEDRGKRYELPYYTERR